VPQTAFAYLQHVSGSFMLHSMFIREIKKRIKSEGKIYEYLQYRLIEAVRTQHGPRHQIVLNLGNLEIPREKHKTLADLIEQFVKKSRQQDMFEEDEEIIASAKHFAELIIRKRIAQAQTQAEEDRAEKTPEKETEPWFETVDVRSSSTSESRTIGVEHIALTQLNELGIMALLEKQGFTEKQRQYAAAEIVGRMVHPSSERETARWLRETSSLDELLNANFSQVSDNVLHRTADLLLAHKDELEAQLSRKTRDLFSLEEKLILYDLTNTYFESPKRGSSLAKYGRSKEKRGDCPLITLALVVDEQGFPKRSRIIEGNVSEPETLFCILELIDNEPGGRPKTVIIDAGIATEENLKRLREDERFEYVAISRKKMPSKLFSESETKEIEMSRHKKLSVKAVQHGDEQLLLCRSTERAAKDDGILSRRRARFETELTSLRAGLSKTGTRKKVASVMERIGRIKERYGIGYLYTIEVEEKDGKAVDIKWRYHKEKQKEPGEYLIRTSLKELKEEELSSLHRTLTMIESAFRWLKSELGIRPSYHQLDHRMTSHIFISVLAYFVLAPILNKLHWGGKFISSGETDEDHAPWEVPYGWRGLVRTMSSQTRVTTSLSCKDGGRITMRTTVDPTLPQENLYRRLNMNPRPLKRVVIKEGAPIDSTM
jgi:transposase